MRTIREIKEAFGQSGAKIVNGHHETRLKIAAETEPAEGRYLDRLSFGERRGIMLEQKTERVGESVRESREAYTAEVERYHKELSGRQDFLKGRLFGVGDAGALSRAALATDAELGAMLEISAHAGSAELGRAVFVASEQRGLGDLMARYFDRVDPDARGLYGEWTEIPPAEVLERQLGNVEALIPEPDPAGLIPRAPATT
jgi:hypothetical protein